MLDRRGMVALQGASCAAAIRLEAHLDCPLGHNDIVSVWEHERELRVHLTHISHPLVELLLIDRPLLQLPVQLLQKHSMSANVASQGTLARLRGV